MGESRSAEIDREYKTISETLGAIESGSELAKQLNSQLDHEKLVLEQKMQVHIHRVQLEVIFIMIMRTLKIYCIWDVLARDCQAPL